jgi:hypothetical protein
VTIFGPDIETEGTDPFSDEIITIQYRDSETETTHVYKRWEYEDERALIFAFLMDWKDIRWHRQSGGPLRVGYRVADFDLPFLMIRCYEAEVFEKLRADPSFVWSNLVHGPSYLDLAQLLGADMVPFEAWRRELLGTSSPADGSQIAQFYEQGDYQKVEEYVTDEMKTLEALYDEVQTTEYFEMLLEMRQSIGFERDLR